MGLTVRRTEIPGLLLVDLDVHGDGRGYFKENWQRARATATGLPDFGPVQHNISFNETVGTTRGIHAEPWDKYVSVGHGRAFGAWVDLRAGAGFGRVVTAEITPAVAVFVPRGVGNAFQTLEPATSYTYLVNDHWAPEATYTCVNLADASLAIDWPIPLTDAVISDKDRTHPALGDLTPVAPPRTLILGANGQLGRALAARLPDADELDHTALDLADPAALEAFDWRGCDTIINAAAFTAVDRAETPAGRRDAWRVNAAAVGVLARIADKHRARLVQVSSDYVFDGTVEGHDENEPFSPLGVYGQSKAAGDLAAATAARHYVIRTSWVVGEGRNFVRTMAELALDGVSPTVVNDQYGRLSFAVDLADGIARLIGDDAPYGTYNLTNGGPVTTFYDIACRIFAALGRDPADVTPVSTDQYRAGRAPMAERPTHSTLTLDKIRDVAGVVPRDADAALAEMLDGLAGLHPSRRPGSHRRIIAST